MGREIKFRAKWCQDGTWVYGFYYQSWNDRLERFDHFISHWRLIDGMERRYFQVKSKTVGQFTGLKDKNGVEIYEGDLIKFGWNPILHDESEIYEFTETVTYFDEWSCFAVKIVSKSGNEEMVLIGRLAQTTDGVLVIGNIYETREEG